MPPTRATRPSTPANRTRAQRACNMQFPKPRNTAAKRKAFNACV